MRKILLAALLAGTVITPAFAQRVSREDREAARAERRTERAESHEARVEAREQVRAERVEARTERIERAEARVETPRADFTRHQRRMEVQREAAQVAVQETQAGEPAGAAPQRRQVRERVRVRSGDSAVESNVNERGRPVIRDESETGDGVANWRQQHGSDVGQQRIEQTAEHRRRVRVPVGARPDRPAPLPETASHRDRHGRAWRTDWRHDHRYDWRHHRRHHRSHFHLGFYFDPFGWGYHRYGIGWRLWPSYYNSNYWLDDPWSYRLPYAPWPYKWVRYYDDALLVDTMTGEVVDVIYSFFW